MNTQMRPLVETDLIKTVKRRFSRVHSRGLPVVDQEGYLNGIITLNDIEKLKESKAKENSIQGIYPTHPTVTYPQETLATALKKMSRLDVGQLPVVLPSDPRQLVGMLYREDVIHAYAVAAQRHLDQRYSLQRDRLDAVTPEQVEVNEFLVESDAEIVNKRMYEIKFPSECMVASIKRRNRVIVPRGDTIIHDGDILVIVSQNQALAEVNSLCHAKTT
jgi:predicted transcriptional regulator